MVVSRNRGASKATSGQTAGVPLLALDTDNDDTVIDLTSVDEHTWASMWRQRTGGRLRCRSCHQPVHAKRRTGTGLRFFAHASTQPGCPSHGESARHLHLKARFAAAFRAAGYHADVEVVGDGWRADVLATDGTERTAIEIQLSPIHADAVDERTRRHRASGVTTMWVTDSTGHRWARTRPSVYVGDTDLVEASVAIPTSAHDPTPRIAAPASIERFVQRWTERRLTPIDDPDALWAAGYYGATSARVLQLDGCVDAHIAGAKAALEIQRRRTASVLAEYAELQRVSEPTNRLMEQSLQAFLDWFAGTHDRWAFDGVRHRDAHTAAFSAWDHGVGILIHVGILVPNKVLAVAEPRRRSQLTSVAWTAGWDPDTDVSSYSQVLTPASGLAEIKPTG